MPELDLEPHEYRYGSQSPVPGRWLFAGVIGVLASLLIVAFNEPWSFLLLGISCLVVGFNYAKVAKSEPFFRPGGLTQIITLIIMMGLVAAIRYYWK